MNIVGPGCRVMLQGFGNCLGGSEFFHKEWRFKRKHTKEKRKLESCGVVGVM